MRGRKADITSADDAIHESDMPAPPDWLAGDALEEWERVLPILVKRGSLTRADLATFTHYCIAVGQVAVATRTIAVEGQTFMGASGPKRHPAVVVRDSAMTQVRQIAAELGLTPASRSRPAIREGSYTGGLFDDLGLL